MNDYLSHECYNLSMKILGIMSGTSADGVDVALVEEKEGSFFLKGHHFRPYKNHIRRMIFDAMDDEKSRVSLICQLNFILGEEFAHAARDFVKKSGVKPDLVSSHGQTIFHIPRIDKSRGWIKRSTLQIGEPSFLAEELKVPVISDFRVRDMAAGGEGAPLVPFADYILFRNYGKSVSIHNIGGISNLTYVPKNSKKEDVIAFDTGPGNALIDLVVKEYFDMPFDAGGEIAKKGKVHYNIVEKLLSHPYFNMSPPKSTGRELFNWDFISWINLKPEDFVATITFFTAKTIEIAYRKFIIPRGLEEILIAGGGAYNVTLINWIKELLPEVQIFTFEEKGLNSKAREAMAFAILGFFAYKGIPNNLPQVTGAAHEVVMGKLTLP